MEPEMDDDLQQIPGLQLLQSKAYFHEGGTDDGHEPVSRGRRWPLSCRNRSINRSIGLLIESSGLLIVNGWQRMVHKKGAPARRDRTVDNRLED